MGDIPEIRMKVWVGRDRTVQVKEFEPVKLNAGVQHGFDNIMTAKEISDWMKQMEIVVMESLNRQEEQERIHKSQMGMIDEKIKTETGKPVDKTLPAPKETEIGEWKDTRKPNVKMKKLEGKKYMFKDMDTGETWIKEFKD